MERYLVIGTAKTGTTAISKTIQNTRGISDYYLEPKKPSFFEHLGETGNDAVVKIIYDHWRERPRLLNAIVFDEFKARWKHIVFITRDPRAELVSRLHYLAFAWFGAKTRTAEEAEGWVEIFRRKEENPKSVSLWAMVDYLHTNFGVLGKGSLIATRQTILQYARYLPSAPRTSSSILRYEDFVAGKATDLPFLSGSRDVGKGLQRTKRSGGAEDWGAYVLPGDRAWIDNLLGDVVQELGYDRQFFPAAGPISPQTCSEYVSRIISEAQGRPSPAQSGE